jgi:hypothetical protein
MRMLTRSSEGYSEGRPIEGSLFVTSVFDLPGAMREAELAGTHRTPAHGEYDLSRNRRAARMNLYADTAREAVASILRITPPFIQSIESQVDDLLKRVSQSEISAAPSAA